MLEVKDLSFSYVDYQGNTEGVPLFSSVSFSLSKGQNVLILASPGSGKTTLSRLLAGVVPKYADGKMGGKIVLDGIDLSSLEPWDLLEKLVLVPQDPGQMIITGSVEDEVAFPLESLALGIDEMTRRVDAALDAWGMIPLRKVNTSELSGGERRRLLLSVASAIDAPLWILDESFDDLDIGWRGMLKDEIRRRDHASIVLASHYLTWYSGLFDAVYVLENGRLLPSSEAEFKEKFGSAVLKPLAKKTGPKALDAKDVTFSQTRRSSIDPEPFTLSVPSFHLEMGEIVSLVGLNGSGKSTFSHLATGLRAPDHGSFLINGLVQSPDELKREVGYFYQNPDYQIFLPTVHDELMYGLSFSRLGNEEKEEAVASTAALFSLRPDDSASLLSFGGRKCLQAAIYYLLGRSFYILDELDSALPYREAERIVSLFLDRGAGILLISHDNDFATVLSHRHYHIEEGVLS